MLISWLQCSTYAGRAFRAQSHICLHCCTCCCVLHRNQFADLLELLAFMAILVQAGHGTLQSLPSYTLACSCLPHNHVTMPGHFAVKNLYDLGDKVRDHLSQKTWHVSCSARKVGQKRQMQCRTQLPHYPCSQECTLSTLHASDCQWSQVAAQAQEYAQSPIEADWQ